LLIKPQNSAMKNKRTSQIISISEKSSKSAK